MNEFLTLSLSDHCTSKVNIANITAQLLSLTYVSVDFVRQHHVYKIRILAAEQQLGNRLEVTNG